MELNKVNTILIYYIKQTKQYMNVDVKNKT